MIRLLIIFILLCGNFCLSQNEPTKKEFLNVIRDSLPSDSWRICNIDNSFYTKDTLYLFKRDVSNDKVFEGKQYNNCCNIITWNFINQNKISQFEEGWCGNIVKGVEISSENIKFKVIEKNNRTILMRFWKKKLLDAYFIIDLKNVSFDENQKSKLITLVRKKE
jgi:hypothetical protein